jgi:cytochrome c biogenesis factor
MLRGLYRFLLSVKTAILLYLLFILTALIGSVKIPANLALFSGIDDAPLFRWLSETGKPSLTWWIYVLIIILALLALSTIACTIDALLKRYPRRMLLLKLSPQIMHFGVLFIMLGHLLTAATGMREDLLLQAGEEKEISTGGTLTLREVRVKKDRFGYDADWITKVEYRNGESKGEELIIRPVRPVRAGRYGFFFRSATTEPEMNALIRVTIDNGAPWALLGGAILCLGSVGFAVARFRG